LRKGHLSGRTHHDLARGWSRNAELWARSGERIVFAVKGGGKKSRGDRGSENRRQEGRTQLEELRDKWKDCGLGDGGRGGEKESSIGLPYDENEGETGVTGV